MSDWDDYFSRDLPDADADRLEEALFERGEDAAAATWTESLVTASRWLAERGTFFVVITGAQADAVKAKLKAIVVDAGTGGRFSVVLDERSFPFDVLLTYYHPDFAGVTRLDIENVALDGRLRWKRENVPFNPGEAVVIACESEVMVRMAMTETQGAVIRFISVEGGERRLLAEFQGERGTRD